MNLSHTEAGESKKPVMGGGEGMGGSFNLKFFLTAIHKFIETL